MPIANQRAINGPASLMSTFSYFAHEVDASPPLLCSGSKQRQSCGVFLKLTVNLRRLVPPQVGQPPTREEPTRFKRASSPRWSSTAVSGTRRISWKSTTRLAWSVFNPSSFQIGRAISLAQNGTPYTEARN